MRHPQGDPLIGGRRPLQGRKPADKPSGSPIRRTSATPGPARWWRSRPRASSSRRPAGPSPASGRSSSVEPLVDRGGDRRAPVEAQGTGDLQLRCDQLVRLRDRGDPAGPRPGRGGSAVLIDRGLDRDRTPVGGRRDQLPAGLPRVSERRRGIRGRAIRADAAAGPHRRRRPLDRLRDDGGGVHVIGARPAGVARSRGGRLQGPHRGGRHQPDHDRQPSRPARVGQHLRRPHLRLRRPCAGHRRLRIANMVTGHAAPLPQQPNHEEFGPGRCPVPPAASVRQRLGGAHRRGGDRQRRAGLQAAGSRNAAFTMVAMASLLGVLFIGVSIVANAYGIVPSIGGRSAVRGRWRRGPSTATARPCSSSSHCAPR